MPKRARSSPRRELRARPPLQRMLKIHAAIQAGELPNAVKLGRELEVSSRSIARDIEFMRDRLELPIEYDEKNFGYFYSRPVTSFPSMVISEGELFAMVVAEKALQQYRGTSFEKPLMSAFQKVSESLPDSISLNLSGWNDSISFKTSAEPILNLKIFDVLSQATARREQLRLQYRKPGQAEPEERLIDPYHLANVNGEWFLFAFDHLRKDIRTFVPARMLKVEPTGEQFKRDSNFSIHQQLQNSFGIHSGTAKIPVVIQFNHRVADYVREKKWHPSQKLKNIENGGVELQLTLSSLVEIERWILSWGGDAKVIEPVELQERVRAAGRKIAAG